MVIEGSDKAGLANRLANKVAKKCVPGTFIGQHAKKSAKAALKNIAKRAGQLAPIAAGTASLNPHSVLPAINPSPPSAKAVNTYVDPVWVNRVFEPSDALSNFGTALKLSIVLTAEQKEAKKAVDKAYKKAAKALRKKQTTNRKKEAEVNIQTPPFLSQSPPRPRLFSLIYL